MKKILIVEDNVTLQSQFLNSFNVLRTAGYYHFCVNRCEIFVTGELEVAQDLIKEYYFEIYFLDNQINTIVQNRKILAQNDLIVLIVEKNNNRIPLIYNISTHPNDTLLNKYIKCNCEKSFDTILSIIDNM